MRGFVVKGKGGAKPRAVITSSNPRLKTFRQEVASCAIEAVSRGEMELPAADTHVPVSLDITLHFLKPPSVPRKRTHMVVKPDIDKTLRSCLDAMTGIIYRDDAQVVSVSVSKVYSSIEMVEITAHILD
jgi:crossover junction endodeoxyribonuclease RusA